MLTLNQWKQINHIDKVKWIDLLKVSKIEVFYELFIWMPWLLLSLIAADHEFYLFAL